MMLCEWSARIYPRHSEEHLRQSNPDDLRRHSLDCFATLAMTRRDRRAYSAFAVTIQIAPCSATLCPFWNGASISRIDALAAA